MRMSGWSSDVCSSDLYAAKADGHGIHRFYRAELLVGAQNRKALEDDLRHALAQNQFHVAYQPVVSTGEERIVGYEALTRWEHTTRGQISTADFITDADDCGLTEYIRQLRGGHELHNDTRRPYACYVEMQMTANTSQ